MRRVIVDFVDDEFELTLDPHAITLNAELRIELVNGLFCSTQSGIGNVSWGFNALLGMSNFCVQKEKFLVIGFMDKTESLLKGSLTL